MPVNDRLSLVTGFSFSQLRSEINVWTNAAPNSLTYKTYQRLDYIGLPLGLSYDLWKGRNMRFYISTGGMAEKMIHGTEKSTDNGNNVKLDIKDIQYSVYGVVGLEMHITQRLGLGLEPGIGYYFPIQGTDIQTIHSDTPLNAEIRLSLKFDL